MSQSRNSKMMDQSTWVDLKPSQQLEQISEAANFMPSKQSQKSPPALSKKLLERRMISINQSANSNTTSPRQIMPKMSYGSASPRARALMMQQAIHDTALQRVGKRVDEMQQLQQQQQHASYVDQFANTTYNTDIHAQFQSVEVGGDDVVRFAALVKNSNGRDNN